MADVAILEHFFLLKKRLQYLYWRWNVSHLIFLFFFPYSYMKVLIVSATWGNGSWPDCKWQVILKMIQITKFSLVVHMDLCNTELKRSGIIVAINLVEWRCDKIVISISMTCPNWWNVVGKEKKDNTMKSKNGTIEHLYVLRQK